MNKTLSYLSTGVLVAASLSASVTVFAAADVPPVPPVPTAVTTSAPADTSATAGTAAPVAKKLTAIETKQLEKIKTTAAKEIDRRTTSLGDLSTRLQGMTQLAPDAKTALTNDVTTQVNALNQLKTKIAEDSDLETAKTDRQTVTASYRIYALIIPKYRLVAAADRMDSLTGALATLGLKLQARVTTAKDAGVDVSTALTALSDMQAKLNDAKTQYSNALQAIAPLQPDNGDKTVMASNEKTLKDARALLKTAAADLKAARKDVQTLRTWLKTAKLPKTGTATTTSATGAMETGTNQ